MLRKLLLLFAVTPVVELAILVYLGSIIGVLHTILIVVATGVIGAFLAKNQGLATLHRIRSSVRGGVLPGAELLHGTLILIGGLLLLTPGLVTDVVGFAMLVPQTRSPVARWLHAVIERNVQQRNVYYQDIL